MTEPQPANVSGGYNPAGAPASQQPPPRPPSVIFAEEEGYDDGGAAEELMMGDVPRTPNSQHTPTRLGAELIVLSTPSAADVDATATSPEGLPAYDDGHAADDLARKMDVPSDSDDDSDDDQPARPASSKPTAGVTVVRKLSETNLSAKHRGWLSLIADVEGPSLPADNGPAEVVPGLYIGGIADALDTAALRERGVTHICNCVRSGYDMLASTEPSGPPDRSDFTICEVDALDDDLFDWSPHLAMTSDFIAAALASGRKVLVHCSMGLNRAGMVTAAFLLTHKRQSLLESVRLVRTARGSYALSNFNFQKQLVDLAEAQGLLA